MQLDGLLGDQMTHLIPGTSAWCNLAAPAAAAVPHFQAGCCSQGLITGLQPGSSRMLDETGAAQHVLDLMLQQGMHLMGFNALQFNRPPPLNPAVPPATAFTAAAAAAATGVAAAAMGEGQLLPQKVPGHGSYRSSSTAGLLPQGQLEVASCMLPRAAAEAANQSTGSHATAPLAQLAAAAVPEGTVLAVGAAAAATAATRTDAMSAAQMDEATLDSMIWAELQLAIKEDVAAQQAVLAVQPSLAVQQQQCCRRLHRLSSSGSNAIIATAGTGDDCMYDTPGEAELASLLERELLAAAQLAGATQYPTSRQSRMQQQLERTWVDTAAAAPASCGLARGPSLPPLPRQRDVLQLQCYGAADGASLAAAAAPSFGTKAKAVDVEAAAAAAFVPDRQLQQLLHQCSLPGNALAESSAPVYRAGSLQVQQQGTPLVDWLLTPSAQQQLQGSSGRPQPLLVVPPLQQQEQQTLALRGPDKEHHNLCQPAPPALSDTCSSCSVSAPGPRKAQQPCWNNNTAAIAAAAAAAPREFGITSAAAVAAVPIRGKATVPTTTPAAAAGVGGMWGALPALHRAAGAAGVQDAMLGRQDGLAVKGASQDLDLSSCQLFDDKLDELLCEAVALQNILMHIRQCAKG